MSGTSTQTVGNLIALAMKLSGAIGDGQTASAEQTQDAFALLNAMLATWNTDRYLVYALQDLAFTSTGAVSYTIGAGQNFNIARPTDIAGAYVRQFAVNGATSYPVDFPCQIIKSYEDYSKITIKNLPSLARCTFYDSAYPVGNVYFWPVPLPIQYECHVLVKTPLVAFTGLTETLSLPPSYTDAVIYNLAVRLGAYFQLPPRDDLVAIAKSSANILRNSNAQVPRLSIDSTLYGNNGGNGWYNIFSDNN